jgi:hypothetical protein
MTSAATEARSSRPRRPPASPAERELVRRIAGFVVANGLDRKPWVVAMTLVNREFPGVRLESALTAFVFRSLLVPSRGAVQ